MLDRNDAHRLLMKNDRVREAGENKSRELFMANIPHLFLRESVV